MRLSHFEKLFSGEHLSLYRLLYNTEDGQLKNYEVASRRNIKAIEDLQTPAPVSGISAIVTDLEKTRMLFLKEFRPAINRTVIHLVEGMIEPGETIEQATCRELMEETGHTAGSVNPIYGPTYAADAISDIRIQTMRVICEPDPNAQPENNPVEPIDVFWCGKAKTRSLLASKDVSWSTRAQMAALLFVTGGL